MAIALQFADRFSALLFLRQISLKNGHKRSAQMLIKSLKILFLNYKMSKLLAIWRWQIFDDFSSTIYQHFVSFFERRFVRFPLNQHNTLAFTIAP
jgi:hypothetical protein